MARHRKLANVEKPVVNGHINISAPAESKFIPMSARTEGQKLYFKEMASKDIIIVTGPAGCGKTTLAVSYGIEQVYKEKYTKLIVTRPTISACGETLGYLPGSLESKLDPFVRPIYDAVDDMLPPDEAKKFKAERIEICPLAFARGRTFKNKFVICDEMSNATLEQLHMIITRLGEGSRMVLTGDMSQSDLPKSQQGALNYVAQSVRGNKHFGVVELTKLDIQRHVAVTAYLNLMEEAERPRDLKERLAGYGDIEYNEDDAASFYARCR